MTYSDKYGEVFGRLDVAGNVTILHTDGTTATRLDAGVYPVGSQVTVRYEHAAGITLSAADAQSLGIEIEIEN